MFDGEIAITNAPIKAIWRYLTAEQLNRRRSHPQAGLNDSDWSIWKIVARAML